MRCDVRDGMYAMVYRMQCILIQSDTLLPTTAETSRNGHRTKTEIHSSAYPGCFQHSQFLLGVNRDPILKADVIHTFPVLTAIVPSLVIGVHGHLSGSKARH
jgi:hypothetical protein